MNPFANLSPQLQATSLVKGAEALASASKRIADRGLRWSIADLRLDPDARAWLRDFAGSLQPDQLDLNLSYQSRLPKFGLIFLAVAAEHCRESAEEGEVWPTVRRAGWMRETRDVLFNANCNDDGAPRPRLCDAIQLACKDYGLRNVVGRPRTRPWYDTIKLQFGFTIRGLRESLGNWLVTEDASQAPTVVRQLMNDAENKSQTFRDLMELLNSYRRRFASERSARATLAKSPWIRPEWQDELLAIARRPTSSSGTALARRPESTYGEPSGENEKPLSIVGLPTLLWKEDRPRFKFELSDDLDDACQDDPCSVFVDEKLAARLIRRADGRLVRMGDGTRTIEADASCPVAFIQAIDGRSQAFPPQAVSLFDSNAPFEAWISTGAGYRHYRGDGPWDRSQGYVLRLPKDAAVEPGEAVAASRTVGGFKWIRLLPGWPEGTCLRFDGEEPVTLDAPPPIPRVAPPWSGKVGAPFLDVDWKRRRFRIRVTLPTNLRLIGGRLFGEPITWHEDASGRATSDWLGLQTLDPTQAFDVRLRIGLGDDATTVSRTLRFRQDNALLVCRNGRWERHDVDEELDVGELASVLSRVHADPKVVEPELALLQGRRTLGLSASRTGRPLDYSGYGLRVVTTRGRFNPDPSASSTIVAERTVDRGCVRDCLCLSQSATVEIRLRYETEPSDRHRIVALTCGGHCVAIPPSDFETRDPSRWIFDRSRCGLDYSGDVVAIGIAYAGRRIGAWWANDWHLGVAALNEQRAYVDAATVLRWFAFPMLDGRWNRKVRTLVYESPFDFARVWLSRRDIDFSGSGTTAERVSPSDVLRFERVDPAWSEVVDVMLSEWKPQAQEVDEWERQTAALPGALAEEPLPFEGLLGVLCEASPLLACRVFEAWLACQSESPDRLRPSVFALASRFERGEAAFDVELGRQLGLAPEFVRRAIDTAKALRDERPVAGVDRRNLDALSQHPEFRRRTMAELLRTIELGAPKACRSLTH